MTVFLYSALLKCDSGIAVLQIDDAAAAKTVLLKRILHRQVVPVRVNAQIGTFRQSKFIAKAGHPPPVAGHRDPVDHTVGFVIEPAALIDSFVGRVIVEKKAENAKLS